MGEGPQANSNFAEVSCGLKPARRLDGGSGARQQLPDVEAARPPLSRLLKHTRTRSRLRERPGAVKLMIVGPFSSSSTLRHVSVLPRPSRAILLLIGSFPCHSADATPDWTALDQWQASVCPGGGSEGAPAGERRLLLREQAATFGLFVCTQTDTPAHLDDSRHQFVCVEQPRPPVTEELLLPCLIPGKAAQLQLWPQLVCLKQLRERELPLVLQ